MTKVEIVSTFLRDNENDFLTQTNFLFPSLSQSRVKYLGSLNII